MSILKWAVIMLLVSLVAALFGFTDLAAASADVAKGLFYMFLVIFLVLLVLGMTGFRRYPDAAATDCLAPKSGVHVSAWTPLNEHVVSTNQGADECRPR